LADPGGSALGGDDPKPDAFSRHGLKPAGNIYVLESESAVKTKTNEVRLLSRQLRYALMQQQGVVSPEEYQRTIKGLDDRTKQLRAEINLVNQQMNQVPRYNGGRYRGGGFSNNYAAELYNEAQVYKNQLQMELNQDTAYLNQLKSQPFDKESRSKVDADVHDRRQALEKAVGELRQAVDATNEKYAQLAKDDEVKKALDDRYWTTKSKVKLGPSKEFEADVKLLERIETESSGGDAKASPSKSLKKNKKSSRTKRSSRVPDDAGSPF
jgi:small-conductance mechanosensitive channel